MVDIAMGDGQMYVPAGPDDGQASRRPGSPRRRFSRTVGPWFILGGSLGASLAIYFGFLGSAWVDSVATWTAAWSSKALNVLGSSTTTDGTILSSDSFAVNIVAECTAVGPLVLFVGAVIAYPSPAREKGLGIVMGLLALTSLNLVRIMTLFWIGSAYPKYLDVAHLIVWQTAIILFAIVLWLFWVERIVGARDS